MLPVLFLSVLGALPPLATYCTPDTVYVCRSGSVVTYPSSAGPGCLRCASAGCETNPANNLTCYPATKSCAVCGTSDTDGFVRTGYALNYRTSCTTPVPCENRSVVDLDHNSTFRYFDLNVTTSDPLRGPCPLLVFSDVPSTLRLADIVIECTSSDASGAAILVTGGTDLDLTVTNVNVSGTCRSALLVSGGTVHLGDAVDRPRGHTNLRATLSGIRVTSSVYRTPIGVVLTNVLGTAAVTAVATLVVQPAAGAESLTLSGDAVNVVNITALTQATGPVYEADFNTPGSIENSAETERVLVDNLRNAGGIVLALLLLDVVLFGPRLYSIALYRRARRIGIKEE